MAYACQETFSFLGLLDQNLVCDHPQTSIGHACVERG
jgi:hypothetical protein